MNTTAEYDDIWTGSRDRVLEGERLRGLRVLLHHSFVSGRNETCLTQSNTHTHTHTHPPTRTHTFTHAHKHTHTHTHTIGTHETQHART